MWPRQAVHALPGSFSPVGASTPKLPGNFEQRRPAPVGDSLWRGFFEAKQADMIEQPV